MQKDIEKQLRVEQADIPKNQIVIKLFNFLNQVIPVLIVIFIFLEPFSHITSIKEICFYLSALIVFILVISNKIEFSFKSPLTIPFGLLLCWASLSFFFSLEKGNTFHDIYAHLLKYIILFYILINFFNSKKSFNVLIWIIIISLGVLSFSCIIYFYFIKAMPIIVRLGVPEANVPVNSIGLITVPPLFLQLCMIKKENKLFLNIILMSFIGISSLALLLSKTHGAIIGLIFPMLILLRINKRRMFIFVLFFLILAGYSPAKYIFSINNWQVKWRTKVRPKIWYTYYQIIKDRPVVGTGFGMQIYDKKLVEKYNAELPEDYKLQHPFLPHNILFDITIRTGIIGLMLFSYIIVSFFRASIKIIRNTADDFIKKWMTCITAIFVSILIQSMFTDTLLSKQAYLFYLTLSLMAILWRLDAEALN